MKKILMVILDGFALREEENGNAVKLANMKFFNKLWEEYPHSLLEASGEAVGLPEGLFGNSEVGHGAIGLGRKIKQRITVVNEELESKNLINNANLNEIIEHVNTNDSTLHLMGLLSDGRVHSDINYILKIIPYLKDRGIQKLVFHVITDGRDTSRRSSLKYIKDLQTTLNDNNIGVIGSVSGRFYAMDRDNNYERTREYYNMLTYGTGLNVIDLEIAINNCYLKGIYDEHLPPLKLSNFKPFEEHDALIWLNFRQDRTRQIINAIANPEFDGFQTKNINNFKVATLFSQEDVKNVIPLFEYIEGDLYPLGEYFSDLGLTQARIAETEKYSHVTKFFNSEKSARFKGTYNYLIPSPKVNTYDEIPIMSAKEVTDQTIKCLEKDFDFILVNYANPDMVGHTGNIDATIKALQGLDNELEKLITAAEDNFYKVMILSDHGNADYMIDEQGDVVTTHSNHPVPFILLDKNIYLKEKGELTSVAPTLLKYMDIAIPIDMKESRVLIVDDM